MLDAQHLCDTSFHVSERLDNSHAEVSRELARGLESTARKN